jgi:hypothetical protein
MEALVNPYCSLEDVKAQIKNSDAKLDDDLKRAINWASRWVDEYTARDWFFHDHQLEADELTVDDHDNRVFGRELFLPYSPVIAIVSVYEGTELLVAGEDYTVKDHKLIRLGGDWAVGEQLDELIVIRGAFGYHQTTYYPASDAGDVADQLSDWRFNEFWEGTRHWQLEAGRVVKVASSHANIGAGTLLCTGSRSDDGTVDLVGSGASGSVVVAYSAPDSSDGNNLLTPSGTKVVDTTAIPDLPQHIRLATAMVAAAFCGHNRKDVVGLDGQKTEIQDRDIPVTVKQMLGRKGRLLI